MSYNTDLQTNNTSLQEILATVNSLPEGGSSGSDENSVKTYTLVITYSMAPMGSFSGLYCSTLQDDTIITNYIEGNNSSKTINNVILNTPVILLVSEHGVGYGSQGDGALYSNIDGNGLVHIVVPEKTSSTTNECFISIF